MPEVESPVSPAAAVWWHAGFALAAVALAVALLIGGQAPTSLLSVVGLAAVPGVLGLALRTASNALRRVLPVIWALCAALAVILAGGVTGPLAPLVLFPLLATLVLDRARIAGGAALSIAALAAAGLAQVAGMAPAAPPARLWLTLFALATVAGFGAAAVILALRHRAQAEATEEDVRRLRAALSAARARIQTVEIEAADARAGNLAKSRFLANMSHELRTPLNAVLGFSDTMRMRMFGPMPDRYAEYAELIHESGRHLLDLINDVLDISKIEADKYELEREHFDVGEAAAAALRLMRLQADDAGVALRSVLPVRPLEVDADRRAVKQIVINLLSNALKFTPRAGAVTLAIQPEGDQLEIVVSDTGVGIAAEDLKRLGRPYEQAGAAEARAQGTGLGLSLVRALAGLHGGTVSFESRLGEGTAVTVRLPVLIPAEPVPLSPSPSEEGHSAAAGCGTAEPDATAARR